ncbi:MAG: S8 family serine peptidase [Ignavibacteriales bacterium]|nr:MAG: S8 family serine peptidase [Ignavibacteriales bacterium]
MLLRFFIALLLIPFFSASGQVQQRVLESNGTKYLSGELIIKLKVAPVSSMGKVQLPLSIAERFSVLGVKDAAQFYRGSGIEAKNSGFDRIVVIRYENTSIDPLYFAQKIKSLPEIEWAEPRYIYETSYTPNDPSLNNQYALTRIQAAAAWDISKGDTSVFVGIVDTGVDWDHPDLQANMKINWNEIPNNGLDDDNNGFVDDRIGWDFGGLNGTPDNNPMEDRPDHGSHVAGISAAVTDNGVGIASIGFKVNWLAVKTSQDDNRNPQGQPYVVYGYEGITYAADMGAQVINCSWGGSGYSILGQEVINYAMIKGSLVVAAAGNSNSPAAHYPSGYRGVLSVASTGSSDLKSGFSNYGTTVDVSAPGEGIYNTWQNDGYAYLSGTSMASPLAAGLAALVFSHFPGITPEQVGERLRVTGDDISTQNPSYINQLGRRINALKALNTANPVSARSVSYIFEDASGDGIITSGEQVTLRVAFKNILSAASSLVIGLENKNGTANVVNTTLFAGSVGAGVEFTTGTTPYTFTVNNVGANAELLFVLNYLENNQVIGYEWLSVTANPTYATQAVNNIALTVTSKGTLAYNNYPTNTQGNGFKYMGSQNHMFEGALILGTSATKISDAARNSSGSVQVADFAVESPFIMQIPGAAADAQGSSRFNDNNAGANKIGITTTLTSFSYSTAPHDDYIILRYELKNTNASAVTGLYAGLFFDWDMVDGSGADDYTAWDTAGSLGYVYHIGGNPNTYTGVGLVSAGSAGFRGILNPGGDPGGFSIYDGFTDAEKWQSISGGLAKPQAGGGDISHVISAGPYNIPAGESVTVAFAIAAGQNVTDLRNELALARSKYQEILTSAEEVITQPLTYELSQNYPNPFNPSTVIQFQIPEAGNVSLKVYDITGREVKTLVNEYMQSGTWQASFDGTGLASGVYFYEIKVNSFIQNRKMILLK